MASCVDITASEPIGQSRRNSVTRRTNHRGGLCDRCRHDGAARGHHRRWLRRTGRGDAGSPALTCEVTVIDRRNHHLFQPLLYQVATAGLNPSDIAHPIRAILADQPNVTRPARRGGRHRSRSPDAVIARRRRGRARSTTSSSPPGTTHSYFGQRRLGDARARPEDDRGRARDPAAGAARVRTGRARPTTRTSAPANLTFVVVGGGPTGVETAGAIAEIAFKTFTTRVPRDRPRRRRRSSCSKAPTGSSAPTPSRCRARRSANCATSVSMCGSA